MVPHWERGVETAEVVGVQPVPLRVCALGGSVAPADPLAAGQVTYDPAVS